MATISEIAKRAKVSRTAVSLVINGKPGVSEATAGRVRQVMAEMNYVPCALAQRFASRRAMSVALVAWPCPRVFDDPRHAEMVDAAYTMLEAHNYSLMLARSSEQFLQERRHVTMLRSGQVDGLLLVEPTLDQAYLSDLPGLGSPAAIVNGDGSHVGIDCVRTDDRAVARLAAEHLLSLGHRRVGMIAGGQSHASARDREAQFRETLADAGVPLIPDRFYPGDFLTSEKSGRDGCHAILDRAPDTTAIFCSNDTMALNALQAAKERSLVIPRDLSLIGVDDHPTSLACRPQLSSIRQQSGEIATRATRILLKRILEPNDAPAGPIHELVQPMLMPRESTAPPNADAV